MADGVDLTQSNTSYNGTTSRSSLANIRANFLDEDANFIRKCLIQDLAKFVDVADIVHMKLITLDFFIPAFLDRICNVYDNAPIPRFANDTPDEKLTNLLNEVRFFLTLQDNFTRLRMHGTTIPYVRYNQKLDKLWIDLSLNESNTIVFSHPGHPKEAVVIAYPRVISSTVTHYYIWNKETKEHYYTKKKPEFDADKLDIKAQTKYKVGENQDTKGPGYWPFIDYHYRLTNNFFWGNGMDSIVELVRAINLLLTVCTDDTITESIRILLLNFDPKGTTGEKGQLKSGVRHPFFKEGGFDSSSNPDGKILSVNLYNDDVIKLIENLTDIVSNTHSIDNIIKSSVSANLSGIAIKLKTEPLLQRWAKDINVVRYYDNQLLTTLVEVNNYYRKEKISTEVMKGLSLDYQQPNMVADEKGDYDLERLKWEDGTSSPVIFMMQKNPELNEKSAIDQIKKNLGDTKDLMQAMSISIIEPDEKDNIDLGN